MPSGRCLLLAVPAVVAALAVGAAKSSAAVRLSIAVNLLGWQGLGEVVKEGFAQPAPAAAIRTGGFAQRLLGAKPTATRSEWRGLLDALAEADEKWLKR
eukprot:gene16864-4207_t